MPKFTLLYLYFSWENVLNSLFEPPHDKNNNVVVRPAKTQISLAIRPVWSESSLSAWRNLGSLATHWAHSEDSDQTGQMPRLIWVFTGRTVILLVLSRGGSFYLPRSSCLFSGLITNEHGEIITRDSYCNGQSPRQKRVRTSFKHNQLRIMKSYFDLNHNPDAKDLKQLSQKTQLSKRVLQVNQIWMHWVTK